LRDLLASKPVIVLDIDGVLADFTYGVTSRLGSAISQGAQPQWNIPGLDSNRDMLHDPYFWDDLPPVVSYAEIDQLGLLVEKYGITVAYVTNRNEDSVVTTKQWLYAMGLPDAQVIYTTDKTEACEEIEEGDGVIIGIIEDSPHNIPALQRAGFPVYIRDWMYNRDVRGDRVFSFGEFLYRMEKFCESTLSAAYGSPSSVK
jgi:3-deoxy-D-manno-octulosonate 8-phosphate phosphatase KdsC-like HAD superfamily phosphatase